MLRHSFVLIVHWMVMTGIGIPKCSWSCQFKLIRLVIEWVTITNAFFRQMVSQEVQVNRSEVSGYRNYGPGLGFGSTNLGCRLRSRKPGSGSGSPPSCLHSNLQLLLKLCWGPQWWRNLTCILLLLISAFTHTYTHTHTHTHTVHMNRCIVAFVFKYAIEITLLAYLLNHFTHHIW